VRGAQVRGCIVVPWREPVRARGLIVVICSITISQAVIAGELFERVGWSVFQLLLGVVDDVTVRVLLVVEARPGNRVILFPDTEKAAETHDCEYDAVRLLVENDIFNFADLFA
jgi:hypothetical protein